MAPADAATYCVRNATELQNALSDADNNGQDDQIRVRSGTFAGTSGASAFTYGSSENFSLHISGGWIPLPPSDGCSLVLPGSSSAITGSDTRRGMRLTGGSGTGAITLSNLRFVDGVAASNGGGLAIGTAGFAGDVEINSVEFRDNTSMTMGGGLAVITSGVVTVRNSVFSRNATGENCVAMYADVTNSTAFYFGNNSVVGNVPTPEAPPGLETGGLCRVNGANAEIYNNVFAHNVGADADNDGGGLVLVANHIDVVLGTPPVVEGGNIFIGAPGFVDAFGSVANLRIEDDSPLRDAGSNAFDLPANDLDGRPRINGAVVDIGAYENQSLHFVDGFED